MGDPRTRKTLIHPWGVSHLGDHPLVDLIRLKTGGHCHRFCHRYLDVTTLIGRHWMVDLTGLHRGRCALP